SQVSSALVFLLSTSFWQAPCLSITGPFATLSSNAAMGPQEKLKRIREELKHTFLERSDLIDGALAAIKSLRSRKVCFSSSRILFSFSCGPMAALLDSVAKGPVIDKQGACQKLVDRRKTSAEETCDYAKIYFLLAVCRGCGCGLAGRAPRPGCKVDRGGQKRRRQGGGLRLARKRYHGSDFGGVQKEDRLGSGFLAGLGQQSNGPGGSGVSRRQAASGRRADHH